MEKENLIPNEFVLLKGMGIGNLQIRSQSFQLTYRYMRVAPLINPLNPLNPLNIMLDTMDDEYTDIITLN